jgi:hypothetical protein
MSETRKYGAVTRVGMFSTQKMFDTRFIDKFLIYPAPVFISISVIINANFEWSLCCYFTFYARLTLASVTKCVEVLSPYRI